MFTVTGKGGIIARVISDSISSWGKRITTFEVEYPRFIHSEFMTHRLLSRNCASSRAIPSKKMFDLISKSPAVPIHWGKNQTGMQAYNTHDQPIISYNKTYTADEYWHEAKDSAIKYAATLAEAGYHKQITNRIVEPFQMIKAVVTATEYDNFYWLRNHHAAQPEIKELAECMLNASKMSQPVLRIRDPIVDAPLIGGNAHKTTGVGATITADMAVDDMAKKEYHLPYVSEEERDKNTVADCIKLAVARCAAVSYRNEDYQLDKCKQVYDRLIGDDRKHSSALEHVARVMAYPNVNMGSKGIKNMCMFGNDLEKGISHIDRNGNLWSGNLQGWVQYRKLINDECCWEYNQS